MAAGTSIKLHSDLNGSSAPLFCEEKYRLLDDFLHAVRGLNRLHTEQTEAVIRGDRDFTRFDILIYAAQERKESAKYAWFVHVESHHCEEDVYGFEQSRKRANSRQSVEDPFSG
jgi:hypothetical protein